MSQDPWSETVIWQGNPHFRTTLIALTGWLWIYGLTCVVVFFALDVWHEPTIDIGDRAVFGLSVFLMVVPTAVVLALGFSWFYHLHQYVVTPTHIHVRGLSEWESYPLEKIFSIDVKKAFFVPSLGLYLDIRVNLSDSEPIPLHTKRVRLQYLESPHKVKEIIEKAVKAVNPS